MKLKSHPTLTAVSLMVAFALNCGLAVAFFSQQTTLKPPDRSSKLCSHPLKGSVFARTELFFGRSKPNGATVTDAELKAFIDREVTPQFPDGLTLLSGTGQFKNSTGAIVKEQSTLLIVLYPLTDDRGVAIERIRQSYRTAFQQESVLRVDAQSCIAF